MSIAVIGWQIFIFVTIFISEGNRGWVAAFWVLWTLMQVYALPLSIIQFLTIFLGYKLAGSDEDEKSTAQEKPNKAKPAAVSERVERSNVNKPAELKAPDRPKLTMGQIMKIIQENGSSAVIENQSKLQKDTGEVTLLKPNACPGSTEDCEKLEADSAYITRHNFRKISTFYLQPDGDISIDKIFSVIYDRDLSDVLNQKEATRLYVQKQAMEKKFGSIRVEKRAFSRSYAFSVAPPKFHKKRDCAFITADFFNYLVPLAIEALGEDKVKEFQKYCESHRKEFEGKPDDIFWAHVGVRFNVHITPERVLYGNSGVVDVEKISVDDLRENINETISQMLSLIDGNAKASTLTNLRYAPNLKSALSSVRDEKSKEEIAEFFTLKADLANSLFELYKKQAGYNSYVLPMTLLKACGLEPCKGCCG